MQIRARAELERRRRDREQHNATWGRLQRQLSEEKLSEVRPPLRAEWEELRSDPIRVIPAMWLAESLRRLWWLDFHSEAPAVQRWKYNGGTPRIERELLRGFDRQAVEAGFEVGIYDWGRTFEYGAPPANLQARASDGDMRCRAAIEWIDMQID